MSGIDDLMAGSNDRWDQAARRAQGLADNGLGAAVKTYYTRYFPAGVVILLAAGTVGGMLVFGGALAEWASFLVFGFFLAVLGVLIGGLVYNANKVVPAARTGRVDVLLSLENEERKQVRRQIAGKAAIDPEHLVVTRGAAVQLRKGLATQLLLLAPMFPLLFISQAVRFALRGDIVAAWLMAVGIVAVVIGFALFVRDFRRAGRFLARTAEQAAFRTRHRR
jgi:NADH:ubiquinone oxidoreductase subunit K